jgi:hypothetical protein
MGGKMKKFTSEIFAFSACAAMLSGSVQPISAASWSQPGFTMGSPNGAGLPQGAYFANLANWGIGSNGTAVGFEYPIFIYSTGANFLGASYSFGGTMPFIEYGVRDSYYTADIANPFIEPLYLSWNLGNGFFVSVAESMYLPFKSRMVFATPGATSGASIEGRFDVSYIANNWILSANTVLGIVTPDSVGLKDPDYFNIDWTIVHEFGKWNLGLVGYGGWDIQTTAANKVPGPGRAIGVGGLVGYNFGTVGLTVELTHQLVTGGDTNYGPNDTRVWATLFVPLGIGTAPVTK